MVFRPFNLFVYALSRLWPRRRERIVFVAWLGHQYTDNSRHLFEYVREHYPNWEVYWCGREEVRERVPPDAFIRYGSFRAFLRILTAKYVFITHGFKDVAYFNLTNGAVTTYLGHGLTLKHMGARISDGRGPVAWIKRLLR